MAVRYDLVLTEVDLMQRRAKAAAEDRQRIDIDALERRALAAEEGWQTAGASERRLWRQRRAGEQGRLPATRGQSPPWSADGVPPDWHNKCPDPNLASRASFWPKLAPEARLGFQPLLVPFCKINA